MRFLALLLSAAGCAHSSPPLEGTSLRLSLARSLIDSQSYEAAFQPLRQVVRSAVPGSSDEAEAHALLGIVYREKGLVGPAEEELRRAIRIAPYHPMPHSDLGILFAAQGRTSEAIAEERAAVAIAPELAVVRNNLAFALYVAGRYREAATEFEAALRADPSYRRARVNLGFAWGRDGDLVRARQEFDRVGTPAEMSNNMGLLYLWRRDLARACAAFAEALRLAPRFAVAEHNRDRCEKPAHLEAMGR